MFGAQSGGGGGFGFGQNNQQSTGGFGSNTTGTGFGGGFGQPAQNQPTGFGSTGFGTNTQSSGFGSTGFGASSAAGGFGQKQGFGATPATTGGGGLFGSNTATSGFGAAAGGGGFGTGATGGTGFGSSTSGTGLFGSKTATTGFGSNATGGGMFGGSTTATNTGGGFGAAQQTATGGFGSAAANSDLQPPAQGTQTTPFTPFVEKDAASSMNNHFQTISFTAPYQKWSLEELRLQDYMQGRTKASGPTGFGSGATGGFGAFGQPQQQQTAGGFGQAQTTAASGGGLFGTASGNTGFGSGATGGGFGSSTTTGTGGLFGAKPAATGGMFGSSTTGTGTTSGGLFGAQNNTTSGFGATNTTGGFGQPAASNTTGGLFGAAQNQQKPAGFGTTGGFGAAATGGFGQPATGSTLFGQPQQPAASNATGAGGLFGTAQQSTGGFGQQTTSAFGGGGFGQTTQQQQPATSGFGTGAFGQAQAQTPAKPPFGGFGAASTTPAPAAGGLFGQQQAQQTGTTGGLFGGNKPFGAAAAPAAGGGLFGGQQTQQPAQTGGLFGQPAAATGTTGGLFGQAQQPAQSGGLFGNQQKPGGLFGQPAQTGTTGGGLFGSTTTATQPQGSLFGQPAQNTGTGFGQTSGGLFGNAAQPAQQGFGGSLFQSAQQQQLQQQQGMQQGLTASIMDQRPYGNVSLLDASIAASSAPGLLATPISGAKKKAAMIPHNKIAPRQPALTPRVASPFSRSSLGASSPMLGGSLGRTFSGSSSRIGLGGSVFDSAGVSDDTILNTAAFAPGANRPTSLKRLVIDRNLRDPDLFVKEGEVRAIKGPQDSSPTPDSSIKKTVSFDASPRSQTASPASGVDLGYMRTPTRHSSAPIPSPAPENALVRVPSPEPEPEVAEPEVEAVATSSVRADREKKGEYWSMPTVQKLKSLPREKLASIPDLIVGRTNFGQISFDQPVDLTKFADNLDAILGGVITFADRVCTVYPPGWDKPSPGNGLNVPATITLEECFPTDREHKQPIRDPEHPRYQFHLRRLKNIKDTEFVDYLVQDGIWIFKVQHFTTYGLQEDDDEETDAYMEDSIYTDATPTRRFNSSVVEESSFASPADITFEDDSIADDTFDFKRSRKGPNMHFGVEPSSDLIDPADASGESVEGSDLSEEEGDSTQILPHDDVSIVGEEDDTQLAPILEDYRETTPEIKLGLGRDWTDQLSRTISPVKTRAPLGFRGPITSARNPFGDVNNVDFSESLFASRNRDFESPYRPSVRTFASPVVKRNKKSSAPKYKRPEAFDQDNQQPDDREWRQCIRPTWGPKSEFVFSGVIEGGRPRGFGEIKSSKTRTANLKYSSGPSPITSSLLELQLSASEIMQDHANIPFATLDVTLEFAQFAKAKFGNTLQQQHEKSVWQLASILFDPLEDGFPPENAEHHVRFHLREKKRKLKLSNFFEEIVHQDVMRDEQAASSTEISAFALLSGHKVDEAVDHLILGNDLRLATLIPLIGGDKQAREDVKRQLSSWRQTGVLAEIPLAVRALYELVSGNVGLSEGVNAPMEDATPSFWLGEMFGLDWRRTFAMRLWYEIFEDENLEKAVATYDKAFHATETEHVRHPEPWYRTEEDAVLDDEEEPIYDTLWGLLNIYSNDTYPLEKVLLPRSYSPNPCDFRLAWQMRMMLAEKQVRDLTEEADIIVEGEKQSFIAADRLTIDFASQLEAEGEWHWAVFVLMHLTTAESRAFAIKDMLAKHVADLISPSDKLDFIVNRLLIPSAWVYEAKALQARFQQDHFEEVECLLNASAWTEAHKTLLNHAGPLCIINEDLEKLHELIGKFTDSALVEDWMIGAQVYLDFIFLCSLMHHHRGYSPVVPKVRGIPKNNTKRDVAKRLMEGLPKMAVKEFLPGVAVREMSRVLADYVLKSEELGVASGTVLRLPLTEDQVLYKELTIKAREGMVMG